MDKYIAEDEAIALIAALAGEGGGGSGDGDMKKSVYDDTEEVANAGGIKAYVINAQPSITVVGKAMTITIPDLS